MFGQIHPGYMPLEHRTTLPLLVQILSTQQH